MDSLHRKILFISDTHGTLCHYQKHKQILELQFPDAVICMGDLYKEELIYIKSLYNEKNIPVYGIPGNHEPERFIEESGLINLHLNVCDICGIKVAGFGGCIQYKNNYDNELCFMTDDKSIDLAKAIPPADIFVTHSNFKEKDRDMVHSGLSGITWYINEYKPQFHFYGHVHERNKTIHKNKRRFLIRINGTISICVYKSMIFDTVSGEYEYLF